MILKPELPLAKEFHLAITNAEKQLAGYNAQVKILQDELNRLDEILMAREKQKAALEGLMGAPTSSSQYKTNR
jgi:hypothetical protein